MTNQFPDHVRRGIAGDDVEIEFRPPSFERWLGRLQMLRTLASMSAFLLVWTQAYTGGISWEVATVRGIVAALVFYFVAWAVGLFVFGEIYVAEVQDARETLKQREHARMKRIERYYRERLEAQAALDGEGSAAAALLATSAFGTDSDTQDTAEITQISANQGTNQQVRQQRAA